MSTEKETAARATDPSYTSDQEQPTSPAEPGSRTDRPFIGKAIFIDPAAITGELQVLEHCLGHDAMRGPDFDAVADHVERIRESTEIILTSLRYRYRAITRNIALEVRHPAWSLRLQASDRDVEGLDVLEKIDEGQREVCFMTEGKAWTFSVRMSDMITDRLMWGLPLLDSNLSYRLDDIRGR